MSDLNEMIKAIVLAGRDEGYMEAGDDISATSEVLVYFNGYDQKYDQDEDEEVDDLNNEIFDIYINAKALEDGFSYEDRESIFGIDVMKKNEVQIRAVYEVDRDYLHMNDIEDVVNEVEGLDFDAISAVIETAYDNL